MKYDFDSVTDRSGTAAWKWQVKEGELPMWVADMEIKTAPEVIGALEERAAHGIFGYTDIEDAWYEAYTGWWERRHGFTMKREGLIFCTGVIPAISSMVRKLTTPNEKVVILTPVYDIFYNCIENNGCRALECELVYKDGAYSIDFEDLEKKLADPQSRLLLLSNPHNPTGNIWSAEELQRMGELSKRYGVTVISDEVHCDIVRPGKSYVPFASVSPLCAEVSASCLSPSKAFNLAGIHSAAVYAENEILRHKVWRGINTDEAGEPNVFAQCAAEAAFNKGGEWLDALMAYLFNNRDRAEEFIKNEIPGIETVHSDATYLLWMKSGRDAAEIREKTGLILSEGREYGKGGEGFVRMNLACPSTMLEDGLGRLKRALENI